MTTIYTVNGKVLKNSATDKWLIKHVLPVKTLRFEFSNADYDPTQESGWKSGSTWTQVSTSSGNIWDWNCTGSDWSRAFERKFQTEGNNARVLEGNLQGVTSLYHSFYNSVYLTEVRGLINTSGVTNVSYMFAGGCPNLETVELFDTSNVTNMYGFFWGCQKFSYIPLFDTSKVNNMNNAFQDNPRVTGGALALYQQASTQTTPPANHTNTFNGCGSQTTTGAAELAQIPSSWGGTGE